MDSKTTAKTTPEQPSAGALRAAQTLFPRGHDCKRIAKLIDVETGAGELARILPELFDALGVFLTPLERLKNWNDFKQDAERRIIEARATLAKYAAPTSSEIQDEIDARNFAKLSPAQVKDAQREALELGHLCDED